MDLQQFRLKKKTDVELSTNICYVCCFCGKITHSLNQEMCERLSGERFYCSFCLRHKFNAKDNHDILIMSFRGLIGNYYYTQYCPRENTLWFSELHDMINLHVETGLMNPIFSYDPETFYWFVDFSKVESNNSEKIDLEDVQLTTENILNCFNLEADNHIFLDKFNKSIQKFYDSRYRPNNHPILIPTPSGLSGFDSEKARNFLLKDLVLRV